jgi:hypothetical protein
MVFGIFSCKTAGWQVDFSWSRPASNQLSVKLSGDFRAYRAEPKKNGEAEGHVVFKGSDRPFALKGESRFIRSLLIN